MLRNWKRKKKLKQQNPYLKKGRLKHMIKARVFLNGELISTHDNPRVLTQKLRKKRSMGEIKKQVNVIYYEDTNEIIMNSDQGRARRPAIIVENGKHRITPEIIERPQKHEITFDSLVETGLV